MGRHITGFQTEQDVRLTLEAMEKKGWKWMGGQNPTEWNGWRRPSGDYSSLGLGYHDNFGQAMLDLDKDNINFREAILELGGKFTSNTSALPEYFTIPCTSDNKKNPLWKKYIDWLNEKYDSTNMGNSDDGFYGNHRNGDTYNNSYEMEGEQQITLEEWDSIVNPTDISSLPEYFYIERDLSDQRWMKFIDWINDTYGTSFTGKMYLYYGWDGYKGGKSCWDDVSRFDHNPKKLTLDEWASMVGNITIDSAEPGEAADVVAKLKTVNHTNPSTGYKIPEPADLRLRTATGDSGGHWASTRVDSNDALRMAHDAPRYSGSVRSLADAARYRTATGSLAGIDIRVDAGVPAPKYAVLDEAMSGPYVQPEVPVKKSRYSDMLDLI